jgi:hypothetical protein
MPLDSNETEVIGSWIVSNGKVVSDPACSRIQDLLRAELELVAVANNGWERLFRDPADGRYWELFFPHGELQAGGPQALRVMSLTSVQEKYGIAMSS